MNDRSRSTRNGSAWRALLGAACLAAWLPLQAADAPRPEPKPAEPVNRAQLEQRMQAAQQRLEQAARELADLSLSMSDEAGTQARRIVRAVVQRAMLGMAIDMREAGPGGEGVRVISVSPGGAAEAAGIKANDVVVSLDGKPLRAEGNRTPQQQLLDITRAAKPGESMAIEYRRDGKLAKTQVVPKSAPEAVADVRIPGLPDLSHLMGPEGPGNVRMFRFIGREGGGFGAAELVELTPALGNYFGADKGLLVVRAPQDTRFKLQDGDVIIDIDGRVPSGVGHAFQILDSYRPGETVRLRILRQKKRMELAVEIPQSEARREPRQPPRQERNAPPPPVPPAGPASPPPPPGRDST